VLDSLVCCSRRVEEDDDDGSVFWRRRYRAQATLAMEERGRLKSRSKEGVGFVLLLQGPKRSARYLDGRRRQRTYRTKEELEEKQSPPRLRPKTPALHPANASTTAPTVNAVTAAALTPIHANSTPNSG
jgi:hypothetical protein